MVAKKEIVENPKPAAESADTRPILQPPVDISEDAEGITLIADIPGVSKESLNIQVDNDTLVIEGEVHIDAPADIKPLYADVRSTRYRRSFALSSELETGNIEASLKDGVLTLRIHKRPETRPRKIEVTTG
ncbi:Hsp20/alpha crystallin family protein [Methylococcus sp. EFPC2]|uniref:Hsp20/alpha crystallin family protein n=1 Tax=Methylococcus sp. EFPC2 TaxID=2812648 RepID=UPI0019674835|nr:Hsp20/alpha crystallin family protein [Methylococcus sp. EFPC2]QSA98629.1 Hsp20/alpha crystallin family protein [Methylococcus sp. EFPC2]